MMAILSKAHLEHLKLNLTQFLYLILRLKWLKISQFYIQVIPSRKATTPHQKRDIRLSPLKVFRSGADHSETLFKN